MIKHNSDIFQFDKQATETVFNTLSLEFSNKIIQSYCLPIIKDVIQRHVLDIGVDYEKPWEEIEMNDYYQIEYLFVGKLKSKSKTYIPDDQIGINIFEENMFGKLEFDNADLLNLTLIINKKDATNTKKIKAQNSLYLIRRLCLFGTR